MRGYVEEAPHVKTLRALLQAARVYSAASLIDPFGAEQSSAASGVVAAALAHAEAVTPKKRRKCEAKR